jgi:hypothetical protein
MPTLSASAAKGMNRTPLTPKVAARATTTPAPAIVTPQMKRGRDGHNTKLNGTGPSLQSNDIASPVSSFLSNNVTPRSGSRQSRVDSANSTPTGTPSVDRNDAWDNRSGLGISPAGFEGESLRRQVVTFSPQPEIPRQDLSSNSASKFFYASDAKSTPQPPPQPRPLSVQQRSSTFFYANGDSVGDNKPKSPTVAGFAPLLASAPETDLSSKFVYANGTPDVQPPTYNTKYKSSGPGSTVSTSSRMTSSRQGALTPGGGYPQRPVSPVKLAQQPSVSSLRSAAAPSVAANRGVLASAPILVQNNVARRRISIDTSSRVGGYPISDNGISASDVAPLAKVMASHPMSEAASPVVTNQAMGFASILQATEDLTESEDSHLDEHSSDLQSPTKSTHGGDQLSELVVNARRERKVQDLEITNASLEAINRSLERQLRKQTTELRRYRRLSRSGRLSLASLPSSILPGDSLDGRSGIEGANLSDLGEEDGEDEDDEIDRDSFSDTDLSDTESASASDTSPLARASRDMRHQKHDEKRLQLDLSKHRQLLVDSQKINQSLKRCLNWTEELIKEGQKALAYNVRVSDVELGGRVLAPPDEEDEYRDQARSIHNDDTLYSPKSTEPLNISPEWSKQPQDRDSAIELPGDGN